MAYNQTYSDSDISAVVIDTIVKVFILISSVATLIVLVVLYNWIKKRT